MTCAQCATDIAPALLACPTCHRLVHGDALKALAAEATAAAAADPTAALVLWRRALELLPPQTRQHAQIAERIEALGRRVDAPAQASSFPPAVDARDARPRTLWAKLGAGVVGGALLLWKLKAVAAFVLTKGKLLLAGLTQWQTLLSMALSLGVYWAAWGWRFALGLVISLYVHEMGHVVALRRYGIRATAPMFIPGIGAFVRLKQYPANAREDARVGIAGPIWGLGAALVAWLVSLATGWESWAAIARVGAWVNLFNLLPLGPFDGGRAFRSLSRVERWWALAAVAAAWFWTRESMLILVGLGAFLRAVGSEAPRERDRVGLAWFVVVIIALALLCTVAVGGAGTTVTSR